MTETDPGRFLVLHRAPEGLMQRALARRARRPRPVAFGLAAAFLLGVGVGLLATPRRGVPSQGVGPLAAEDVPAHVAPAPAAPVPVRLVLHAPRAGNVGVAATWNDWDPGATPMHSAGDGVFYAVVPLARGQYEYMFVVDGEQWVCDPAAPLTRDDGFGRRNAILEV